jgi:hypothetical protein
MLALKGEGKAITHLPAGLIFKEIDWQLQMDGDHPRR